MLPKSNTVTIAKAYRYCLANAGLIGALTAKSKALQTKHSKLKLRHLNTGRAQTKTYCEGNV